MKIWVDFTEKNISTLLSVLSCGIASMCVHRNPNRASLLSQRSALSSSLCAPVGLDGLRQLTLRFNERFLSISFYATGQTLETG